MARGDYPQNPGGKKGLTELLDRIEHPENYPDGGPQFPEKFALAVRHANDDQQADQQAAIDCVDSWLDPSQDELIKYGICKSRRGGLSRCTDKTLMLYPTLKKKAPQVFQ